MEIGTIVTFEGKRAVVIQTEINNPGWIIIEQFGITIPVRTADVYRDCR